MYHHQDWAIIVNIIPLLIFWQTRPKLDHFGVRMQISFSPLDKARSPAAVRRAAAVRSHTASPGSTNLNNPGCMQEPVSVTPNPLQPHFLFYSLQWRLHWCDHNLFIRRKRGSWPNKYLLKNAIPTRYHTSYSVMAKNISKHLHCHHHYLSRLD